jgi:hypothetical protein
MFGRGPGASVDLRLSGDLCFRFERFSEITSGTALTAHLASFGVARTFNAQRAALAGALISRLANHHESESKDSISREWGLEFLRLARVLEVKLDDQADRWDKFSILESANPASDAGEDRTAYALAHKSIVLRDEANGARLVRAGWFLSYVRREAGTYNADAVSTQMDRVGWQRPGREGWIKATSPIDQRRLRWRFYTVPDGWEDA